MGRVKVTIKYEPPWRAHLPYIAKQKGSDDLSPTDRASTASPSSSSNESIGEHDNSDNSLYQYPALFADDDTRLVRLLPGRRQDPVHIELKSVSSTSTQEYMAISYAWGNNIWDGSVLCQGKIIRIPWSLCLALKYIRNDSHPVDLWVDAISINQKDEKEKSLQVRRMWSIFKNATKVMIWLGKYYQARAQHLFRNMQDMVEHDFQAVPSREDRFWTSLTHLYQKAWFSRLWCLQEIVLADKPTAEVRLGTETIAWDIVARTAVWISSCPAPLLPIKAMVGVDNANLMHIIASDIDKGRLVPFLELLGLTWKFNTSEKRDAVYALLGLPTIDTDPSSRTVYLQPDYTKRDRDVYLECAVHIIRQTRSLRILSHVQSDVESPVESPVEEPSTEEHSEGDFEDDSKEGSEEGWPTWVPRWDEYKQPMLLPTDLTASFNASAHLPPIQPRIKGSSLFVRGAKLSTIQNSFGAWDNKGHRPSMDLEDETREWLASSPLYADYEDLREPCSLILTAGKSWTRELVDNVRQHAIDMVLNERLGLIDDEMNEGSSLETEELEKGDSYRFYLAQRDACSGRAVLRTVDGHVGLGPEYMKKGDVLYLLSNCPMPMILRPSEKKQHYRVVGEAYIHGIMFGEAFAGTDGQKEVGEIELF
ncbi:heterokaryon incompatibility protein-domain-containing protein [Xylariaceae sp. FL0255]|nr:heterokaryon incompatibility protein-domain-containing protein [Xylariaceae sp. FL0255]